MVDRERDEDDRLGAWIREAGDPTVEPDSGHIEHVRHALLDRTKVARRPTRWPRWASALAGVGIAAALLIGLFPWGGASSAGWAHVVGAVRAKPWIHLVAELPDGKKNEAWISPSARTASLRWDGTVTHYDLRSKTQQTYDPVKGTITRTETNEFVSEEFRWFDAVFRGILKGDDELDSPMPRTDVVDQRRNMVQSEGRKWIDYELSVRMELYGGPDRVRTARVIFRVDPDTRLPQSMRIIIGNGREPEHAVKYEIDYPDEGPTDIYALGVPRSAKIDDRLPTGELAKVIEANEAGRAGLMSYCAVVVSSIRESDDLFELVPHRLWRKGNRWRLEMAWPTPEARKAVQAIRAADELPAEISTVAWWHEYLTHFGIWAMEVSDGKAVYRSTSSNPKTGKWEAVQRASTTILGQALPYAVERHAYPSLSVSSENSWAHALDLDPEEGPPNTILLTFRATGDLDRFAYHTSRFWLDPTRGYATCRHETVGLRKPAGPTTGESIPYRQIDVMEDFKQSPEGFWYPTVVRQKRVTGSNEDNDDKWDKVYRYFLDFEAEIPDSLFEPKTNEEADRVGTNKQ